MYISVIGIIGSGKSTLAEYISKEYNFFYEKEPVKENEYLDLFYEDKPKWVFPMQVSLEIDFYNSIKKATKEHKNVVTDWGIPLVFVESNSDLGIMYEINKRTFMKVHDALKHHMPDIVIYLTTPINECLDRIAKRSRNCEKKMSELYLKKLDFFYQRYIFGLQSNSSRITKVYMFDNRDNADYDGFLKSVIV